MTESDSEILTHIENKLSYRLGDRLEVRHLDQITVGVYEKGLLMLSVPVSRVPREIVQLAAETKKPLYLYDGEHVKVLIDKETVKHIEQKLEAPEDRETE